MKEKCVKFFRYFFPIFFLIYFGNITLFTHSHIMNGVTIVHSHPFKKDNADQPAHQHTPAQFQLIHQLSSFGSEDIPGGLYVVGNFSCGTCCAGYSSYQSGCREYR